MLKSRLDTALLEQETAARLGFDWPTATGALDKVREETNEVHMELRKCPPTIVTLEEEVGDLMFSVINVARKLNINPNTALDKATLKFRKRFKRVLKLVKAEGLAMDDAPIESLERLWLIAKNNDEAAD